MGDLPIAVDQLVLRERRPATRAPGQRARASIEPALLLARLQKVPDVLDVLVGHGVVRVIPVHPLAEPNRLLGLNSGVLADTLAATLGELSEPVGFDIALGVESEVLFHLDLDP